MAFASLRIELLFYEKNIKFVNILLYINLRFDKSFIQILEVKSKLNLDQDLQLI